MPLGEGYAPAIFLGRGMRRVGRLGPIPFPPLSAPHLFFPSLPHLRVRLRLRLRGITSYDITLLLQ